jgi:hypothetical protein
VARDRGDYDVLHLHGLERHDWIAGFDRLTWSGVDAQDGAWHRGDYFGRAGRARDPMRGRRPGGSVHVGRWSEREREAPAGEIEVDGVTDANALE